MQQQSNQAIFFTKPIAWIETNRIGDNGEFFDRVGFWPSIVRIRSGTETSTARTVHSDTPSSSEAELTSVSSKTKTIDFTKIFQQHSMNS